MYSVREITKDVWWVGGHDHRLTLFENMHPIPLGVSYNAYLLFDKKSTILFDTAEWTSCPQLMENIIHLLEKYGRDKVDYLVVNHMECDHSASVTAVLEKWAPTIISTEKGFMLMRQFAYNPDDYKTETVKEGDTRTFEDHTIAFVEAPMVHWPEVMITLDVTNGVLFSADAFGSFIALDGKLFAKEVNYPRDWIDEARRYLTNIVGKYGPEVMHLVGKVLKLDLLPKIKYICALHGLVWEADNFPTSSINTCTGQRIRRKKKVFYWCMVLFMAIRNRLHLHLLQSSSRKVSPMCRCTMRQAPTCHILFPRHLSSAISSFALRRTI